MSSPGRNTHLEIKELFKKKILLVLIFGLILLLFVRGIQMNLTETVTERIKLHAIPVAISVLYHHHAHDYTGLRALEIPFQGPTALKELIPSAVNQVIDRNSETYYWVADDKGFEDYVIASFYLFGPHLMSMYYLWFVILLATVFLFLGSFHKHIWALSFVSLILLGIHVAVSALPLVTNTVTTFASDLNSLSLVSLYDTRFLDILALIAMFHMVIYASNLSNFKLKKDIPILLGQILILLFLLHARSSLMWEVASVLISCAIFASAALYIHWWRNINVKMLSNSLKTPLSIALILIASLIGLNGYKHLTYHPRYFSEMGARTFWHNALMGLSYDPYLSSTYNLDVNDLTVARAVINFAKNENECSSDISHLEPQVLLNSLGNWGVVNWKNYEICARKYFFSILSHNKLKTALLYSVKKTSASLNVLMITIRNSGNLLLDDLRNKLKIGWYPFSMLNSFILTLIFIFSLRELAQANNKLLIITSIALISSFIPSVLFYPSILTEGGLLVILAMFLYLILGTIINKTYRLVQKFFQIINGNFQTASKIT